VWFLGLERKSGKPLDRSKRKKKRGERIKKKKRGEGKEVSGSIQVVSCFVADAIRGGGKRKKARQKKRGEEGGRRKGSANCFFSLRPAAGSIRGERKKKKKGEEKTLGEKEGEEKGWKRTPHNLSLLLHEREWEGGGKRKKGRDLLHNLQHSLLYPRWVVDTQGREGKRKEVDSKREEERRKSVKPSPFVRLKSQWRGGKEGKGGGKRAVRKKKKKKGEGREREERWCPDGSLQ